MGPIQRILGAVLEPLTTPNTPATRSAESAATWGVLAWVRRSFFNRHPTLAYNPTTSTQVDDIVTGTVDPVDADGDQLTYTATAPVNGGSVDIAPDGTFTYTPTAELAATGGSDTFAVTASDAGSGPHLHGVTGLFNLLTFGLIGDAGHTATVTVTVDVNAAPQPAAPSYTLGAAEHTTGAVPGELHVTDADSDALSYTVTGGPADGLVTLAADGTFTYTPTPAARHEAAAEDASPDELADSFTVTVDDNHGRTVEIPVVVAIDPNNTPPTITGFSASDPDSVGAVNITITVTDPDTDPITYLVVHDPAYGTVAPVPGGFRYTPTTQARHDATVTPGADIDTFQIMASDLHHGTDTATATVVISPANTAPSGLAATVNTPDPVTGAVTGTVTGVDADGDPLTYSGSTLPAKGEVVVATDGSFTYTPTPGARHNAAADTATAADKQDSFSVTADDGHGGTAGLSVTVAVSPVNTAPTGTIVPGSPEPATGTVTGTSTFTDPDGDPLTYTASVNAGKGAVTVNPDGTFTYTPTAQARHDASADGAVQSVKADSFTVTVNDGHGAVTHVPVTVAVSPANTAPSIDTVVPQPDPATGVVNGSFVVSDPDGDSITYSTTTTPGKGLVSVSPDGSFAYTPTAQARHNASTDGAGTDLTQDSFTVTVDDGHGSATAVAVLVTVSPTNAGPTGSAVPSAPDPATGVVTGTVSATDPDGDPLTFTGSTSTAKGAVIVNGDGTFTYTPTAEARHNAATDGAGTDLTRDSFTITVDDAHGGQTPVAVTVAVGSANAAPTIDTSVGIPDPGTGAVTGGVIATDPDGDNITYTLGTAPTKGTVIVDGDGAFAYTPTAEARHNAATDGAGTDLTQDGFTVTVDDGHGATSTVSVSVAVGSANAAPTAQPVLDTPDSAGNVSGSLGAEDADSDEMTYIVTTLPNSGSVTINPDGTFNYDPTDAARLQAGLTQDTVTDSFTVTITDGHGGTTVVPVAGVTVSPAHLRVADITLGAAPGPIASTGSTVYVANGGSNTVSVLDTTTDPDSVIVTIPGVYSGAGAAVSGDSLYVSNWNNSSVTVIDTSTNTVTQTIPSVDRPMGIAISGDKLYAANYGNPPGSDTTVTVIDVITNTVLQTIPVGTRPYGVAASGNTVYVTNSASNTVSVIDAATDSVVGTITVGSRPMGAAVNGGRLYVANFYGNSVSVIDTATNTVVRSIAVGTQPNGVTFSADGSLAYVTNYGDNTVTVIDTATNTAVDAVRVGAAPGYTATTAEGTTYVSNSGGNTVSVITLVTGQNAAPVAADPAYTVTATNPATGAVTGSVNVADPDADILSFTVTDTPDKGSATVNPAGTFTYTPTGTARHEASADGATSEETQDTFSVAVADPHGLQTTVDVTTDISPANTAPTALPVLAAPDATGNVSGSLTAADADSDSLVYTLAAAPTHGSVTINNDGTFTYDPTDAAQLQAGLSAGSDFDSFTISINDGHGSVVPVNIGNVPVAPAHTATVDRIGIAFKVWPVAFSPVENLAYFSNYTDYPWDGQPTAVTVVDTSTDTVVGHIWMPQGPATSLAVSPDGTRVYAPNIWSNYLTVIDTSDGTIAATIQTGPGQGGVAVSPDGQQVYVTGSNAMTVIDTATNTVTGTIPVVAGTSPIGIVVSPNGSRVYTADSQSNTVSVIDTGTNTIITAIPVGVGPSQLAINPDGSRIYTANRGGNNVSVVDTATNTVVATVAVGALPYAVAVSPDGSVVYVTNSASGTVSVIDTSTNTVIGNPIPLGGSDTNLGVAVSPDGSKIYATNAYSSDATVIAIVQG